MLQLTMYIQRQQQAVPATCKCKGAHEAFYSEEAEELMTDRLPVVPPPLGCSTLSSSRMRLRSSSVRRPPGVSSRFRASCKCGQAEKHQVNDGAPHLLVGSRG